MTTSLFAVDIKAYSQKPRNEQARPKVLDNTLMFLGFDVYRGNFFRLHQQVQMILEAKAHAKHKAEVKLFSKVISKKKDVALLETVADSPSVKPAKKKASDNNPNITQPKDCGGQAEDCGGQASYSGRELEDCEKRPDECERRAEAAKRR